MDKSIITFSANEQNLQKTGGIGCYASDTVSYIEVHFALGENWSGYDSIRAVWFNDYKTISTVLDSDGVCIVPHEVLVSRGKVMVNLVGSVLVSDELSDRLTTFPCEALKVSAKAKISGSETAAVTPSQFEQFVAVVISEVEKVTGMTAQAETLPAGSQATARYENGILYLGIPQGIQGERGETGADGADGNGIASVVYNADYSLTLIFDNGERFTTPPIRGERGPAGADGRDGVDGADGVTPNLSIGNVETLEPSEDAYVTRRGTDANPIFDFGIPKGDDGTVPDLDLILPTDTASGDIASIPDGQSVVPVKSLKVTLEPIQDLHGYDKPWSGGDGKNKLTPASTSGANINLKGVTATIASDGSITLNGTATDVGFIQVPISSPLPIKEYTATMFNTVAVANNAIQFSLRQQNVNNSAGGWFVPNTVGRTFTFAPTAEAYWWQIQIPNGAVLSNLKISPMLVEGNTAPTTYSPYSNICPISGHTEVVTHRTGVNLCGSTLTFGNIDLSGADSGTDARYVRTVGYTNVKPNTTLCFYAESAETVSQMYIMQYDKNKSLISRSAVHTHSFPVVSRYATFMTAQNAFYIRAFVYKTSAYTSANNVKFSINYPSTNTEYHAYDGNTYTTTLGRTVYGGTLDVVSGELVVDRGYMELSEEWRWTKSSTYVGGYYVSMYATLGYKTNTPFMCSHAKTANALSEYVFGTCYCDQSINFRIMSKTSTLQEWKDYIVAQRNNGTPITVCYELATPQTYQLDPQTISLLHGNNNVRSDGSVVMVYNADVGLYIDKKLGASGTRALSMTRTLDTKSEETKTDAELTKSDNIQLAED